MLEWKKEGPWLSKRNKESEESDKPSRTWSQGLIEDSRAWCSMIKSNKYGFLGYSSKLKNQIFSSYQIKSFRLDLIHLPDFSFYNRGKMETFSIYNYDFRFFGLYKFDVLDSSYIKKKRKMRTCIFARKKDAQPHSRATLTTYNR